MAAYYNNMCDIDTIFVGYNLGTTGFKTYK